MLSPVTLSHTRGDVLTLSQIGPVAGAYLAAAEGWRWTFWLIAIAVSGLIYARTPHLFVLLMERKVRRLRHRSRRVMSGDIRPSPPRQED